MIKAGVIGHPIAHSLSPKLHNFWLKKYNIDGEYKAYDVAPDALEHFIRSMPEKGFAGCNVTIPHKEKVFELLQKTGELDETAAHVGAVNTIVVKDGTLWGTNTDVIGFRKNIETAVQSLPQKRKAVILGGGGALLAVVAAVHALKFEGGVYCNRTPRRIGLISKLYGEGKFSSQSQPWDQRDHFLKDADLLVNATSLGMVGKPLLEIDLSLLPKHALVTDIVYNPLITPLLAAAKARGNPIVDGLGMLLHQAVPGFEAWFGKRPEVTDELRAHILSA